MDETKLTYEVPIEFNHLDANGYISPYGYQHIVNIIMDRHLFAHQMNFERLMEKGISWVILSLSIEVKNPIKGRDHLLVGKTWFAERRGIFFRREMSVYSEDGTHVLDCAMYSTLLNLETRSIFRNRELPFYLMDPTEEFLIEAKPTFKEKHEYTPLETLTVKRSQLDMLGHVNNSRYSELCFDALTDEEALAQNIKRMDIYFVSELKLGERFTVGRASDGNRTIIRGYNETNEKPAFYGVFVLGEREICG